MHFQLNTDEDPATRDRVSWPGLTSPPRRGTTLAAQRAQRGQTAAWRTEPHHCRPDRYRGSVGRDLLSGCEGLLSPAIFCCSPYLVTHRRTSGWPMTNAMAMRPCQVLWGANTAE